MCFLVFFFNNPLPGRFSIPFFMFHAYVTTPILMNSIFLYFSYIPLLTYLYFSLFLDSGCLFVSPCNSIKIKMQNLRNSLPFHLNLIIKVQVTVFCTSDVQVQVMNWTELRSASEGSFYHLKQLENYLRFPATASACVFWSSAWVTHGSTLRLNLCMPKQCVQEMCSTCVSIIMLNCLNYVNNRYSI